MEKQFEAIVEQMGYPVFVPGKNPRLHVKDGVSLYQRQLDSDKLVASLEEAIEKSGLRDGMTISFHHHFRAGDYIVNMVLETIARMGVKNLRVAASSLTSCHAPLIEHIKNGVVTSIETSGCRGELANAISHGLMERPMVFRTHGGRAAAIETGELHIDVAFLGAPSCDAFGNANGYTRGAEGKSMCGSLGYARPDAQYADKVVIITDNLVPYPNTPFAISQRFVDYVVVVDAIGDPQKIMSGATRFTKNPRDLLIAERAAEVIVHSGYFYDGFSMQTGTGGASLAVTRFLRDYMLEKNVKASFALGGITGAMVGLHEDGLIGRLLDVQSFDLVAANSLKDNRFHRQIDANYYANPYRRGSVVNALDVVVLSALEIDVDFNVNVLTGSDGIIRGAIGGHPDTAAGAALTVIVCPLLRGRMPCVLDRVGTLVTPGSTVDVLVTDQGIAVNPARPEVRARLEAAHIPVTDIHALREAAEALTGRPDPIRFTDRVVGLVTYRDGSMLDVIRRIAD